MRITLADGNGPILVEGPVELVLADGTIVSSDRPVVALCVCRGSERYPFCDTSHRRRARPGTAPRSPGVSSPSHRATPPAAQAQTATDGTDPDP